LREQIVDPVESNHRFDVDGDGSMRVVAVLARVLVGRKARKRG